MKINSIHIASFGKFKDYTLDFGDRLNVVFGENEAGKSTIMAFIRMMFYGTSAKSSDIDKNLRKKYMPFESDLMAGSIDFTHKGVSYTLERTFKASNAADRLKLINRNTGEITNLSGKNDIGSTFFGLSEAAFEKSVYIGNMSIPSASENADGELNSKLSNIMTSLDEDVSLESVKSKLLKAKELLMSRSGRIGIYDKAKRELEDTEQLFEDAKKRELEILEIQQKISLKQASQELASKQAERLFELLKNAKKLNLKAALEKYFNSCGLIEDLEEKIRLKDGLTADKVFLNNLKTSLNEVNQIKKDILAKEENLEKVSSSLDELKLLDSTDTSSIKSKKSALEDSLSELRIKIASLCSEIGNTKQLDALNTRKVKTNRLLILVGVITLVASAGLYLIYPYLASLAIAGIALILKGAIVNKGAKSKHKLSSDNENLQEALHLAKTKESALLCEIESLNSRLIEGASVMALIDSKSRELLEHKETLITAKDLELNAKNNLSNILSSLKNNYESAEDAISIIEETLSLIEAEKVKLSMSYELTGCSSKEEAKMRLDELNTDSSISTASQQELDSAQRRIKEISEEKNRLASEIASLKQALGTLLSSGESVSVLERKIEKMNRDLAKQKAFCASVDVAMQTLDLAFGELRNNFSHILEEKTAQIFSSLTGGAYDSVNISKNFEIAVKSNDSFGTKEWQYLSLGTAEQAYFALRLALAQLIDNEGSHLPLLLDDSFSEYDDARAKTAVEFLNEYSNEAQIILFTCHSRIVEVAKNLNSEIKKL